MYSEGSCAGVPRYFTIADSVEAEILRGVRKELAPCPSARQLAHRFDVSVSTAARALGVLCERNVLVRRPGATMSIGVAACVRVHNRQSADFERRFIVPLLDEASRLGISTDVLLALLKDRSRLAAGAP